MEVPKCKICSNKFDSRLHRPIILPKCGHTYCRKCLLQSYAESSYYSITCPEDNKKYEDINTINELPENTLILNMMKHDITTKCKLHLKFVEYFCLNCKVT